MAKTKKADQDIVKKAKGKNAADDKKASKAAEPVKGAVSKLEVHTVEPVIKPQNKRNKPKGKIKNGTKKTNRKTNAGTIKEGEKTPDTGEKGQVAIPDRGSGSKGKRGGLLPPWWDWS